MRILFVAAPVFALISLGLPRTSSANDFAIPIPMAMPLQTATPAEPAPAQPAAISAIATPTPAVTEPSVPTSPAPAVEAAPAETATIVQPPIDVYIIDGVNPLGRAGVNGLASRLRNRSSGNVQVDGWYSGRAVEREIRAAHAADPSRRIAVIGFSAGAYTARAVANRLTRSGVPVEVLGYIGGDFLRNNTSTQVPGVGRVVNIRGDGYVLTGGNLLFNGTDISGASNVRLEGTDHYDLPSHPSTVESLSSALTGGK